MILIGTGIFKTAFIKITAPFCQVWRSLLYAQIFNMSMR
nr:MAG TPA: hypothetical protein [Caudoviricetes sp.]